MTTPYRRILRALAILALPFLAGVILLRGLTVHLDTFHAADETYWHYPTILAFVDQPDIFQNVTYESATTPLFHYLMAGVVRVAGKPLWGLRLVNVLFSFIAMALFWALLDRWRGNQPVDPLPFALFAAVSPYFFGNAFIVTTDSLAILLIMAMLISLLDYVRMPSTPALVAAAMALCLATLTRQTTISLSLVAGSAIIMADSSIKEKVAGLGAIVLALIPFGLFVIHWGGFVPPHYAARHVLTQLQPLRPFLFVAALIGAYSVFFEPRRYLTLFSSRADRTLALVAGGAGSILLILFPLIEIDDNGFLWTAAAHVPAAGNVSLLFWVLVPMGIYTVASQSLENRDNLVIWFTLLCLTLPFVTSRVIHQKYLDPFVCMALLLIMIRRSDGRIRSMVGMLPLLCFSLGYFVFTLLRS